MKKPLTICIIDDNKVYQFTITRTIEIHNLASKVLTFSDGEEALDFIIDNIDNIDELPDIIFLDINMPVMDGFEFMEEYIKLIPRIKKKIIVYMVTSSMDPVDMERAQKISEISNYLIKPINPDQLTAIIGALENKSPN